MVNWEDEGFTSGIELSGPSEYDPVKPRLGPSYKYDDRRSELPEEIDDEKPEDVEDPDDEKVMPDWAYPEDNDADYPPKQYKDPRVETSEFFRRNEKLQDRFNEHEVEGFLKLLNVKPNSNYNDRSLFHHATGVHAYYDEAQEVDPQYHLVAEVER